MSQEKFRVIRRLLSQLTGCHCININSSRGHFRLFPPFNISQFRQLTHYSNGKRSPPKEYSICWLFCVCWHNYAECIYLNQVCCWHIWPQWTSYTLPWLNRPQLSIVLIFYGLIRVNTGLFTLCLISKCLKNHTISRVRFLQPRILVSKTNS